MKIDAIFHSSQDQCENDQCEYDQCEYDKWCGRYPESTMLNNPFLKS